MTGLGGRSLRGHLALPFVFWKRQKAQAGNPLEVLNVRGHENVSCPRDCGSEAIGVVEAVTGLQPGSLCRHELIRIEDCERKQFNALHDLVRLCESLRADNRVVNLTPVDY